MLNLIDVYNERTHLYAGVVLIILQQHNKKRSNTSQVSISFSLLIICGVFLSDCCCRWTGGEICSNFLLQFVKLFPKRYSGLFGEITQWQKCLAAAVSLLTFGLGCYKTSVDMSVSHKLSSDSDKLKLNIHRSLSFSGYLRITHSMCRKFIRMTTTLQTEYEYHMEIEISIFMLEIYINKNLYWDHVCCNKDIWSCFDKSAIIILCLSGDQKKNIWIILASDSANFWELMENWKGLSGK